MASKLFLGAALGAVLLVLMIAPADAYSDYLDLKNISIKQNGPNLKLGIDSEGTIPSNPASGTMAGFGLPYNTPALTGIAVTTDPLVGSGTGWHAYEVEFEFGAPNGCITNVLSEIDASIQFKKGNMDISFNHNDLISNDVTPLVSSFTFVSDGGCGSGNFLIVTQENLAP